MSVTPLGIPEESRGGHWTTFGKALAQTLRLAGEELARRGASARSRWAMRAVKQRRSELFAELGRQARAHLSDPRPRGDDAVAGTGEMDFAGTAEIMAALRQGEAELVGLATARSEAAAALERATSRARLAEGQGVAPSLLDAAAREESRRRGALEALDREVAAIAGRLYPWQVRLGERLWRERWSSPTYRPDFAELDRLDMAAARSDAELARHERAWSDLAPEARHRLQVLVGVVGCGILGLFLAAGLAAGKAARGLGGNFDAGGGVFAPSFSDSGGPGLLMPLGSVTSRLAAEGLASHVEAIEPAAGALAGIRVYPFPGRWENFELYAFGSARTASQARRQLRTTDSHWAGAERAYSTGRYLTCRLGLFSAAEQTRLRRALRRAVSS